MVRASETYGYPLVKAMQHRKSTLNVNTLKG